MAKKVDKGSEEVKNIQLTILTWMSDEKESNLSSDSIQISNSTQISELQEGWFVIVNPKKPLKPAHLQKIKHVITSESNKPEHYICAETAPNSTVNQLLSGQQSQRANCTVIVANHASLIQLAEVCPKLCTFDELPYYLEKSCSAESFITLENKKSDNLDVLKTWNSKLQQALNFYINPKGNWSKLAFVLISILSFFYITQTSKKAGISGDEFVQYEYAKLIANYHLDKIGMQMPIDTNAIKGQKMVTVARTYQTDGVAAATIEDPDRLMHLYGSSFDTFTAIMAWISDADDYMGLRHWWNAVFGFLSVFYAALLTRRLTKGSYLWASVALLAVFFMPRFFGESLNNPKDVPFALGYIMSLYYAVKFAQSYPTFRWSTAVGLVFSIALGISIRIGGLLSIAIIGLYLGLKFIEKISLPSFLKLQWKGANQWIMAIAVIGIVGYFLGIYVWPYGWEAPIDNPMKALDAFTNYQVSLRQLFEGKLYDSDGLPGHYLTKYLWITLPIGILIGLALYIITTAIRRKSFTVEEFLMVFTAIFPIFYIYLQKSGVYGGLRHILFTLPSFGILAVLGYYKLQSLVKIKLPIGAILSVGFTLLPASFVAKNSNLSYVYFNEVIGGVEGAYGEYEMDYYLASIRPSCEYLIENETSKNPNKKYEILTYGMDQVKYYFRNQPNVHVGYTRFDDRSEKKWDYAIFYNAYMDKARLDNGCFPPAGTIFTPEVDGKPMGCVVKRISDLDYQGIQAITKEGNQDKGISLLNEYLKVDPKSTEALFYIGNAYANKGNIDSALIYMNKCLELFPEYSRALFSSFQMYVEKEKFDLAVNTMQAYIGSRPKDPEGYSMKAQAHLLNKDYDLAIAAIKESVKINPLDARSYQIGAQCFKLKNDQSNFNKWVGAMSYGNVKTQQEFTNAQFYIDEIYQEITGEKVNWEKYFPQQ